MNLDIRVSVDFFEHHKTRKLIRRLGYEAVFCLQRLWAYAAKHRCDGVLYDMDAEDIIIASGWNGGEEFPAALQEIGFMEAVPSPELDGTNVATNVVRWLYVLHDWREHNSYAADDKRRSEAGRFSRLARTNPEICADLRKNGITSLSADDYQGLRKGVLTVNQIVLRSYNDSPEKPCERTTPDTKDQRPKTL